MVSSGQRKRMSAKPELSEEQKQEILGVLDADGAETIDIKELRLQ